MAPVHELLSEQFYRWELRGRGWQIFDHPVSPEPPFVPFDPACFPSAPPVIDDGRRSTFLSSFVRKISQQLSSEPQQLPPVIVADSDEEEPVPRWFGRNSIVELQTILPAKLNIEREVFHQFLVHTAFFHEPIAFELLATPDRIVAQFVSGEGDSSSVRRQLQAYFPDVVFTQGQALSSAWQASGEAETAIVEFGLAKEFFLPLANGELDPFIGLTGALAELEPGEVGVFQVLFQKARDPWQENLLHALMGADGKPFFVNTPELLGYARAKASSPLFAAVVRIATRAPEFDRAWDVARDLASALQVFAHPNGNELIPLRNDDYPFEQHQEDVLLRQSRRSGMLLNADELIGFVHLPSAAVRSAKLARETTNTKPAPKSLQQTTGLFLGENVHAGKRVEVRLSTEQRTRHTHIVGASGTGKSTLLWNLIYQDIHNGDGIAVFDPHGDLIDRILGSIPQERIDDVVLVDPSDEKWSVGFNILSAHSDLEKNLLASDLVSVFQRLSTSWGDQMGSVLSNAILAFLESRQGGTIADVRRFLIEPAFRNEFLKTVEDSELLYYWQKGFPQLSGNKSIGPILTRLETFLSPKPIRYMVSQRENKLDFGNIMDTGKIFLAKLSQGLLGKENSYLLGSLLISKFQQLAMSRQARAATQRRPFFIFADEFQNFVTPSMAEILTGARKYRVGLILAHQELRQLQRDQEVASAVSTCFTRVVFRVGDDDARKLAEGFASFEARDLQNLETGQAIARVERSDYDFNLSIPCSDEPDESQAATRREEIITASRKKYGTPRADVEALFRKQTQQKDESPPPRERATEKQTAAEARSPVQDSSPPKTETPSSPPIPPTISSDTNQPTVSERKEAVVPPDLGRGGAQHQAIQQRIKKAAEALGFRSVIENQILDGHGSVDLLLERSDQTFACEISISTTIDHEVGNVSKCLKTGFKQIAVVCVDEERLKKISAAILGSLGREAGSQVRFFTPDQFVAHLQAFAPIVREVPEMPPTRRGYRIKRSLPKLTTEEQKRREDAAIRSIADAMKKKSK